MGDCLIATPATAELVRWSRVYGPRWVPFGGGIEYLLLDGFTEDAVVAVADDPPGPAGRWELEVK